MRSDELIGENRPFHNEMVMDPVTVSSACVTFCPCP